MKYNTIEQKEYSQIPQHYNGVYPYRSATDRHESDGWVDIVPFTAPAGYTIIEGTRTIDAVGNEQYEVESDAQAYARQWATNEKLWTAENNFLGTVQAINTALEISIGLGDGFSEIGAKIEASEVDDVTKLKASSTLKNAWDVVEFHGGTFGNISYHEAP